MEFAKQLKIYRKKLNYTQEEMVKFLGDFALKTYQAWEQGRREPLKTYQKMLIERIEKEMEE